MIIAIHQPNYAPWCGFFAKIYASDTFVFYDDAQMTKNSYINRCIINNQSQRLWLTIPVRFNFGDKINQVTIADARWKNKHLNTIRSIYGRTPFFRTVFGFLESVYTDSGNSLAETNINLIRAIADYLGISRRFVLSSSFPSDQRSDDRLIDICHSLGADTYISGKGGENYQNHDKFKSGFINLKVKKYMPIPYDQKRVPFMPGLSILDALFQIGERSIELLTYE